jgi:membrane fusion protein (multidrug efflux system)
MMGVIASKQLVNCLRRGVMRASVAKLLPLRFFNHGPVEKDSDSITWSCSSVSFTLERNELFGAILVQSLPANPSTTEVDPNGFDQAVDDLKNSQANRFVGFQAELPGHAAQIDAQSSQARLTAATPTPPPKRPTGRLLVGTFLMALLAAGAYVFWDSAFRFHAYGQIEAHRVPIRVLTSGIVQRIYVAEGDKVRAGELLAVIDNVDLEHRLHRTRNDLRLVEAQLDALMTRLRRDSHDDAAEYFELASKLRAHRAELESLDRSLERLLKLKSEGIVTQHQYEKVHFSQKAQTEMIGMLGKAVEKLQQRTSTDTGDLGLPTDIIEPALVRIENIKDKLVRLQELLRMIEIRSPITGIVVKRSFLTGNWVEAGQITMEIVEESSTEPVIYLEQESTKSLSIGDSYSIFVEPNHTPMVCKVKRIGTEFMPAPISIERFYDKNEPLLPVALEHDF